MKAEEINQKKPPETNFQQKIETPVEFSYILSNIFHIPKQKAVDISCTAFTLYDILIITTGNIVGYYFDDDEPKGYIIKDNVMTEEFQKNLQNFYEKKL